MSTAQRRALLTLLGLIVTGHAVRLWLLAPGEAPGAVTLLPPASDAAMARHRAASLTAGRPLRTGERLDLSTADAAALSRLPGIGADLARRIVSDREARGPFQTLSDLDRVPGIGPGLLRRVREFVVQAEGEVGPSPGDRITAGGLAGGGEGVRAKGDGGGTRLLDLNSAVEAELLRLPGIGPTKAQAIIAYRQSRGSFASVGDLIRVPGIGAATLAGLARLVTVQ